MPKTKEPQTKEEFVKAFRAYDTSDQIKILKDIKAIMDAKTTQMATELDEYNAVKNGK